MLLKQYTKFDNIDFDNETLPEYIITIRKQYSKDMRDNDYTLTQEQYDKYAAKWARIHDWLSVQYARAKYEKKSIDNKLKLIILKNKKNAPKECKSEAAREKWVKENIEEYHQMFEKSALSEGYLSLFEKDLESAKMNHYLCKGMSQTIQSEKGVESFHG